MKVLVLGNPRRTYGLSRAIAQRISMGTEKAYLEQFPANEQLLDKEKFEKSRQRYKSKGGAAKFGVILGDIDASETKSNIS